MESWSFLSKHGLALLYVGRHPDSTDQEIGQAVCIGERAVRKVMADLAAEEYVERRIASGYNRYRLNPAVCGTDHADRAAPLRALWRLLCSREDAGSVAVTAEMVSGRLINNAGSEHRIHQLERWIQPSASN